MVFTHVFVETNKQRIIQTHIELGLRLCVDGAEICFVVYIWVVRVLVALCVNAYNIGVYSVFFFCFLNII